MPCVLPSFPLNKHDMVWNGGTGGTLAYWLHINKMVPSTNVLTTSLVSALIFKHKSLHGTKSKSNYPCTCFI